MGHPQSLKETDLFGPYRKGLNAFFRREWRFSVEDAQDLTQEASMRAFQCLHQLESPERLEAWLYAIARNVARSHYRHRRLVRAESLEALAEAGAALPHPGEGPDAVCQRRALVRASLRGVRAKNRKAAAVLYYREGEGLSYDQIARLVGETPANCRQLHARYLRLLRRFGREYEEQAT